MPGLAAGDLRFSAGFFGENAARGRTVCHRVDARLTRGDTSHVDLTLRAGGYELAASRRIVRAMTSRWIWFVPS